MNQMESDNWAFIHLGWQFKQDTKSDADSALSHFHPQNASG